VRNQVSHQYKKWYNIKIHTGTIGIIRSRGEGCTTGMAWTEIGQSVVSTHWLHVCHATLTTKIACGCQIHLEWFWFRTVTTFNRFQITN